eukprot:1390049-Rhodomonas_salina.4
MRLYAECGRVQSEVQMAGTSLALVVALSRAPSASSILSASCLGSSAARFLLLRRPTKCQKLRRCETQSVWAFPAPVVSARQPRPPQEHRRATHKVPEGACLLRGDGLLRARSSPESYSMRLMALTLPRPRLADASSCDRLRSTA